jgi:hypothetical protein
MYDSKNLSTQESRQFSNSIIDSIQLGSSFSIWLLQFRCLSTCRPGSLKFNTSDRSLQSYTIVNELNDSLDAINFTIFISFTFKIGRLAWTHLALWDMTTLNVFINSLKFMLEMSRLASSVNIKVAEKGVDTYRNSHIYIYIYINNKEQWSQFRPLRDSMFDNLPSRKILISRMTV